MLYSAVYVYGHFTAYYIIHLVTYILQTYNTAHTVNLYQKDETYFCITLIIRDKKIREYVTI